MKLPTRMIHQSFRYCLGRQSYAVGQWVDWAVENWKAIPKEEKLIIERGLETAFRQSEASLFSRNPLGMDCDRKQWERIRKLYRGE